MPTCKRKHSAINAIKLPNKVLYFPHKITMTVSLTDLYDILSAKLGKEEAKTLVTFIEQKVEQQVEKKT